MLSRIEAAPDGTTAVLWVSCPDRKGRDVERSVFARAVRWHLQDRVFVCHNRCIVFA
jgi:formyltetrahydrofolate hydrolase